MAAEKQENRLQLEAIIGFNGHVPSGLKLHPDQEHIISPLGSTLILENIRDGKQWFLRGHTGNISCIAVSRSGAYIASGQTTSMGSKAPIIIWNYAERTVYAYLTLHKGLVQALDFSPNEKYLVSLGGIDDGSLVVWDMETKEAVCGGLASARSAGQCLTVRYSNTNDNIFVSGGSGVLRVWELDLANRKISPTECYAGKLTRIVKCIEISADDGHFFCGTTSGDIMKIQMKTGRMKNYGPDRAKYSHGVSALKVLSSGELLVGCGSGNLTLCSTDKFEPLKKVQLEGGVTSITGGNDQHIFVGTEAAQVYRFDYESFQAELASTSHTNAVKDVVFPFGTSDLFATCSEEDIRLWQVGKPKEIVRISVPKTICNCLDFMIDGQGLVSGWSDDKIRLFAPETGRLKRLITDAHKVGVTAIAATKDCKRIVSGGGGGMVRVWELLQHGHRLVETMKQHKAAVTCLKLKVDDKECVTTSTDGTCIIWDLVRFTSLQRIIANTMVQAICYHPEEHQIITVGTNRKVVYWEVYHDAAIRELRASPSGAINALDITQDGRHFVTGGEDKLLKVWDYVTGEVTHVGVGHGSSITRTRICCNNRRVVSTDGGGAVLCWTFPHPPAS
ncbi:cilia- and flagella-associated protein 52-like [Cololabis saira]|uniref:cilia- and flagella-associated protein 52-like n=1 Tax=Cololabis saira TaxID=129043 RepID=UPI002AD46B3C|nr:cilia- and flagella-associated protein 52-like [Cololabis saira]